jgi:MFS family permease
VSAKSKNNWAILIASLLDHCDTHIYGLLAPIIAQLFFPQESPLVALVKTHLVTLIAAIARPFGAIYFGYLARNLPLTTLKYALIGVSVTTCAMGLLPTYLQIGALAPLLLIAFRALQSFFASGVKAISGIYLVANNPNKEGFFSALYCASSTLGALLASLIVSWVVSSGGLLYWRYAFLAGFVTSLAAMAIRTHCLTIKPQLIVTRPALLTTIAINKNKIATISIVTGFSYLSYPLAFTLLNSLLPQLQNLALSQVLQLNNYLLCFDCLAALLSSYFLQRSYLRQIMLGAAGLLLLAELALLLQLVSGSILTMSLLRILVIMVGVVLAIAVQIWLSNATKECGAEQYLVSSVGTSIGTEVFGRTIVVFTLQAFSLTNSFLAPIYYIALLGFTAIYCIYMTNYVK